MTAGEQPEVHLSAARWLEQAPAHSFEAWRARKAKRGRDPAKGASVSVAPCILELSRDVALWIHR